MSDLGKKTRLGRIFNNPSGHVLGVAIDHLINYPVGMPDALRTIEQTVEKIVEGKPGFITMNKGIAMRVMGRFAGQVPFIVQQMAIRAGATDFADHAGVEEAVAMGADGIAVSIFVKGTEEMQHIRHLSTVVREAQRYGLPVLPTHLPLSSGDEMKTVSHCAEDIFYAVRMGVEMGADVIKVPFTGDVDSFRDIVSVTPVPVVSAGGPKCKTLDEAADMLKLVAKSGAAGATIGRNVWGFKDIPFAIDKLKQSLLSAPV